MLLDLSTDITSGLIRLLRLDFRMHKFISAFNTDWRIRSTTETRTTVKFCVRATIVRILLSSTFQIGSEA